MKKPTRSLWLSLFLTLFIINPGLVTAKTDPLQSYRDTIKQTEIEAAQNTLSQLPHSSTGETSDSYASTAPLVTTSNIPTQPSNNEKALVPPITNTPERTLPPISPNNDTNNTNPWLKPNTWATAAKVNPWAHVPIPRATLPANPSAGLSHTNPPGPPNIFSPEQQQTPLIPNNTAYAK